jgi:hypothetical protein
MKIWRSYGSGHSARLTVVGSFKKEEDAKLAEAIVEDFVNATWEERYPDINAFREHWKDRVPALEFLGPNQIEFDMGLDDSCDIERNGLTVTVSHIRSGEIGGIIKLMLLEDSEQVTVSGRTGP